MKTNYEEINVGKVNVLVDTTNKMETKQLHLMIGEELGLIVIYTYLCVRCTYCIHCLHAYFIPLDTISNRNWIITMIGENGDGFNACHGR